MVKIIKYCVTIIMVIVVVVMGAGRVFAVPVVEDFEATTSGGAIVNNITLTAPAGITTGELLLLIVGNCDTNTGIRFNAVAGWNKVGESGNATSDSHIAVYWRAAVGGEGNQNVTTVGNYQIFGWYLRISGALTSGPINVSNFTQSAASADPHTIPQIQTTVNNCLAIYGLSFDGGDGDPYSVTLPWVESDEQASGTADPGASGCWGTKFQASAGWTGNAIVNPNISDAAAYFQLAIAPNVTPVLGYDSDNVLGGYTVYTSTIDIFFRVKDAESDNCTYISGSAQVWESAALGWTDIPGGELSFLTDGTFTTAADWSGEISTVTWDPGEGCDTVNGQFRFKVNDGFTDSAYGAISGFSMDTRGPKIATDIYFDPAVVSGDTGIMLRAVWAESNVGTPQFGYELNGGGWQGWEDGSYGNDSTKYFVTGELTGSDKFDVVASTYIDSTGQSCVALSSATMYVKPKKPPTPDISSVKIATATIAINVNLTEGGSNIFYRIKFSTQGLTDKYVQADGTLGDAEVWQTTSTWASTNPTDEVIGLAGGTEYWVSVAAGNSKDPTPTAAENSLSDEGSSSKLTTEIQIYEPSYTGLEYSGQYSEAETAVVASITVAKPNNTAEGDLLVAIVAKDKNQTDVADLTPEEEGWIPIFDTIQHPVAAAMASRVWYKVATANEPANYQFNTSVSETMQGIVMRFYGQSLTAPIGEYDYNDLSPPVQFPTSPDVGVAESNSLVLSLFAYDDDDGNPAVPGYPAGYTGITVQEASGSGAGPTEGAAFIKPTAAGFTGDVAWTYDDGGEESTAYHIVIKPDGIPRLGYDSYYVLGGVSQSTDGLGNVDMYFRVKDFHFSTDNSIFKSGSAGYRVNSGDWINVYDSDVAFTPDGNFEPAEDWTGEVSTITWTAPDGIDSSNVDFRFMVTDSYGYSGPYGKMTGFVLDTKGPVIATDVYFAPLPVSGNTSFRLRSVWTETNTGTPQFDYNLNAAGPLGWAAGDVAGNNSYKDYSVTLDGDDMFAAINSKYTDSFGNECGAESEVEEIYVKPLQPDAPTVNNITYKNIDVTINKNAGETGSDLFYLIRATVAPSGLVQYIQADGTLGDNQVWQTTTTWGVPVTVQDLLGAVTYWFSVVAGNAQDNTPTSGENSLSDFGISVKGVTDPSVLALGYTEAHTLGGAVRRADSTGYVDIKFRVRDNGAPEISTFTTGSAQYNLNGAGWTPIADGSLVFTGATPPDDEFSSATDWSGEVTTVTWYSKNQINNIDSADVSFRFKVNDESSENSPYGTIYSFAVDNIGPVIATPVAFDPAPVSGNTSIILRSIWTETHFSSPTFSYKLNGGADSGWEYGFEGNNSTYTWTVSALNGDDKFDYIRSNHTDTWGQPSAGMSEKTSQYVAPMAPNAPDVVAGPYTDQVYLTINDNPAETASGFYYLIKAVSSEYGTEYVQTDGTLGSITWASWKTKSGWGGGDPGEPALIKGLRYNTLYSFYVSAGNPKDSTPSGAENSASAYSPQDTYLTGSPPGISGYVLYPGSHKTKGPHPSGPQDSRVENMTSWTDGDARVMNISQGSENKSIIIGPITSGNHTLGIWVSQPLVGGQVIKKETKWRLQGGVCQNDGDSGWQNGFDITGQAYLWRASNDAGAEMWPDSYELLITESTKEEEWLISDRVEKGGAAAPLAQTTDAASCSEAGLTNPYTFLGHTGDGDTDMGVDLDVRNGDRIVVEMQYEGGDDGSQAGPCNLGLLYNKTGGSYDANLQWNEQPLYFKPYMYWIKDMVGNDLLAGGALTGGYADITGGMFGDPRANSYLHMEGWPNLQSLDTDSVLVWNDSQVKFVVPDITGTFKMNVHNGEIDEDSQDVYFRVLPQISNVVVDPDFEQASYGQNWHYDDVLSTFSITVYGKSFAPGCELIFSHGGVTTSDYTYSRSTITCAVQIGLNAGTGDMDIYIQNPPDGIFAEPAKCPPAYRKKFQINTRPKIDYLSPQVRATEISYATITILGSNFGDSTECRFIIPEQQYGGVIVNDTQMISSGKIEAYVTFLATATVSNDWRVILTNPDKGYADSVVDAGIRFKVASALEVTSLDIPGSTPGNELGQNVDSKVIKLYGSGFESGNVEVNFLSPSGPEIPTSSFTVKGVDTYADHIDVTVDISSECPTGPVDIEVINKGNGGYFFMSSSMTINAMPIISTITEPSFLEFGEDTSQELKIEGSDFRTGIKLDFGVEESEIKLISSRLSPGATVFWANIKIYDGCPVGDKDLKVINADQGESNVISNAIKINKKPTLTSLSETSAGQGVAGLAITVTGSDMQDGCKLDIGLGITVSDYVYYASSFTVTIDVSDLAVSGLRNATITNPDGGKYTRESYFEVTRKPEVDYLLPNIRAQGVSGSTITVVGKGAFFQTGLEVWFSTDPTGYPADVSIDTGSIGNFSQSLFELQGVNVDSDAPLGARWMATKNPDGGFAVTAIKALTVTAQPKLTGLTVTGSDPDNRLGQNTEDKTLKIAGSGFESGISDSDVYFDVSPDSITVKSLTWKSSSLLEIIVDVSSMCPAGDRIVYLNNPVSGGTASSGTAGGFFVIGPMPVIDSIPLPVSKYYGQAADTSDYPEKKFRMEGSGFDSALSLYFGNTLMTPLNETTDGTYYECDLIIDPNFSPTGTALAVRVVNPDQGKDVVLSTITINKKPSNVAFSRTKVGQGAVVDMDVTGLYLQYGAVVDFGVG
ncbi:MAG: hypothetical protein ABIH89_08225, partial [Elusimicrobiota bacterium]